MALLVHAVTASMILMPGVLIVKSLPLPATEVHKMGLLNTTFISLGLQPGGAILSNGVGCIDVTTNEAVMPSSMGFWQ